MTPPHACDLRPHLDRHTYEVLAQAIDLLAWWRDLPAEHPAVRLHLIASLAEQTEALQTHATIEALDAGYTDTEIAILLGLG